MTGTRTSFDRPVAVVIPVAAALVAALAIAPLNAQFPTGPVCVAGNRAPVAEADTATTSMNTSVTISVLANDTDADGNPLAIASVTQPLSGSAVINADQTITFKPATGMTGLAAFTYVVKDDKGGLASGAVSVTVTLPAPVLALGFEEIDGTAALDSSGRNNHGAVSGASRDFPGVHGGGLLFDGVDDLVTVPHSASLNLDRMTISAWVMPMELGDWRSVVFKEHATSGLVYSLYADTGVSGSHSRYSPAGPGAWIKSGGYIVGNVTKKELPLYTWSHLAATYDGTTVRLYLDGVQVATWAVTGTIQDSQRPVVIGGNMWGEHFSGAIDDVRVYNFALNPDQIRADMGTAVP
jgi:hypothetical protein